MKVQVAQSGMTRLLGRIGVIGALAMVLMASRCSGDDETGRLETTGDVPEESSPAEAPAAAAQEPSDPLGDPFVAPADGEGAQDPAADTGTTDGDDSSILEEPSYEPESAPESSDL